MIGYIKGKATVVSKEFCFIEAGGIGYRVFISEMSRHKIHLGTPVRLLTYMAVREDAILLYGFLTQEEYDLFLHLIGISGIGPKVAQGILSSATVNDFYRMVQQKDVKGITKLPGIGKKTAERILLELKDKLSDVSVADLPEGDNNVGTKTENSMIAEATEALLTLGFQDSEIQRVFRQRHSCQNTEELIRYALAELQRL